MAPLARADRPGQGTVEFGSKRRSVAYGASGQNARVSMFRTESPMKSTATTARLADAVMRDPRWGAVLARDPHADGEFVFSVRTTGVYCRPSCAARQPRPANVAFHATPEDALRAGFRACLRCRPDETGAAGRNAAIVTAACRKIEAAQAPIPLDELARPSGLSRHHFHRVFKSVTGVTPKAYANALRAARVREALPRSGSVTDALYDAGYHSSGRFYAEADGVLGMQPAAFRAGGRDTSIRFAVGESSLGAILVAASERGVCAILMGDDPAALVRELQDIFARATLAGDDTTFDALVARVVGSVEAPQLGLDLPLDVRGTIFQRRVWQALREIPAGETASYSAVAARIGAPRSTRAVAQACASNRIAIAIPCHRVVRRDGALSGYRWGVERKRALLDREADDGV